MNPGWTEGMPDWNKTTECVQWDQHYVPCDFPYTGLSSYSPSARHCFHTFADSVQSSVFVAIKYTDIVFFTALFLAYSLRVMYWFIDTQHSANVTATATATPSLTHAAPAHACSDSTPHASTLTIPFITSVEENAQCVRKSSVFTTNDYCNFFCFVGVAIELLRVVDLNAWDDLIPFTVYYMAGALTRAICYTIGFFIIKLWTNLVFFWCKTSHVHTHYIRPHLFYMWYKSNAVVLWVVLLPVDVLSVWYTPECGSAQGCVNTKMSCVNRGVQGTLLTINVVIGVVCIHYLVSALATLKEGGAAALFKSTWAASGVSEGGSECVSECVSDGVSEGVSDGVEPRVTLDADVGSIFVYDKHTPSLVGTTTAEVASAMRVRKASTAQHTHSHDHDACVDVSFRTSSVQLTQSLTHSLCRRSDVVMKEPSSHNLPRHTSTESDVRTVDDIMKHQTLRIVVYVSIVLLLTCGVVSYDITFCTSNDVNEMKHMSPPCDDADVITSSFNLFYTGFFFLLNLYFLPARQHTYFSARKISSARH